MVGKTDGNVEEDVKIFNEEKGEDTLVEEEHHIERVTVILKYTCCRDVTSDSRVKRVFDRAMSRGWPGMRKSLFAK